MFNKIRLKEILAEYKKVFVQQQWPNEKYKWEAVQCFQENWDINSLDFAQMLKKSLDQVGNLLTSANNFPAEMITSFAEAAPEEVRSMYMELYDESKDLCERIANFKNKSNDIIGALWKWSCAALSVRKCNHGIFVAALSRQILYLQIQ